MKQLFLLLVVLFFTFGCDYHKPPKEIDLDSIFDPTPVYNESEAKAPNDVEKFQDVLKRCKLQLYREGISVDYDAFEDYKSPQFYVDSEENLVFSIDKEANTYKTRSELREGPEENEWYVDDSTGHFWIANLQVLKPDVGVDSFTWMQVHGTTDTFNYPIIRLFWERQRNGEYDHLWSVVIISDAYDSQVYEYTDLGARPEGFFRAEVHFKNNIMDIIINHNLIKTYNVTYWQGVKNYFKAGVYINRYGDGGAVTARFSELHFYDYQDPVNVVSPHH
jgi:hypothetical protein